MLSRPVVSEGVVDLCQDLGGIVLHGGARHRQLPELLNQPTVLVHDSPHLVLRRQDGSQSLANLQLGLRAAAAAGATTAPTAAVAIPTAAPARRTF